MKNRTEFVVAGFSILAVLAPLLLKSPSKALLENSAPAPVQSLPPPPALSAAPVAAAYDALKEAEDSHQRRFAIALTDDAGWNALRDEIARADRANDVERLSRLGRELFVFDIPAESARQPMHGSSRCASCHARGRLGGSGGFIDDGFEHLKPPSLEGAGLLERMAGEINSDLQRARKAGAAPSSHGILYPMTALSSGVVKPFGRQGRWTTLDDAIGQMAQDAVGFSPRAAEVRALREAILSLPTPSIVPPDAGRMPDLFLRFQAGEARFRAIGCAACHVPELALHDGTVVRAFTDLRIHDLSPGGTGAEGRWQTAPLWGLAASAPYLHDGRALSSLDLAIDAHHGEAEAARTAYRALDYLGRGEIKTFLLSLTPEPRIRIAGP